MICALRVKGFFFFATCFNYVIYLLLFGKVILSSSFSHLVVQRNSDINHFFQGYFEVYLALDLSLFEKLFLKRILLENTYKSLILNIFF